MPDSTRGRAPVDTSGTVSSGDVVALGMGGIVSGGQTGCRGAGHVRAGCRMSASPHPHRRCRHAARPPADDAEGCYEQCQDPLSRQWTTVPIPYTREMARPLRDRDRCRRAGPTAASGASRSRSRVGTPAPWSSRDEGAGRAEVAYGSHPWVRGSGRDGARRAAAPRLGLRRAASVRDRSSGAPTSATGPRASWPGGSASPSTARVPARPAPARGAARRLGRHAPRDDVPRSRARPWLEVPRARGRRAAAAALARGRRRRGSSRPAATSAPQLWLGRMPSPYTGPTHGPGSSTSRRTAPRDRP